MVEYAVGRDVSLNAFENGNETVLRDGTVMLL